MYDIDLQKDREHVNSYYYKSKNEYGQIITLEIYEIYKEPGFMNVTFYIATKRKNGFQENLIVGKYYWYIQLTIDLEEYMKDP